MVDVSSPGISSTCVLGWVRGVIVGVTVGVVVAIVVVSR